MFGLLKKAKEKTYRFAVQAYMNDALKTSVKLLYGGLNNQQLIILRDLTTLLLDEVYEPDKEWIKENNVQSNIIAMSCFLYYLEETNFGDDTLRNAVNYTLESMVEEVQLKHWQQDTFSHQDSMIYNQCKKYINRDKDASKVKAKSASTTLQGIYDTLGVDEEFFTSRGI